MNVTPKSEAETEVEGQLKVVLPMLGIFSFCGTIGNSIVIYVFGRRREKLTSTMFILALAGTDLVTCFIIMPFTIVFESVNWKIKYDFLCKLYNFFITFSVPCSCFIMVAIAIDRYFCICHPFLHAINVKRTQKILFGIVAFTCLLGVLTALTVGVYSYGKHTPPCNGSLWSPILNLTKTDQNFTAPCSDKDLMTPLFTGECRKNDFFLSDRFRVIYSKIYASLFLISVLIVLVLYSLIYRSVRQRRALRQRQKSAGAVLLGNAAATPSCYETQLTVMNDHEDGNNEISGQDSKRKHKSYLDKNKVANMKTAFMLFVVTAVFIVAYTPSWLTALKVLPGNLVIFYLYFIYNVINPVIYAFLNQSFRDELRQLISCDFSRRFTVR